MDDVARRLIERFYEEVWNARDEAVAYDILATSINFRGSLGSERRGIEAFLDYVREVHKALGDYRCTIDELVDHSNRVAARMTFVGIHQDLFMGVAATGRRISWAGAAFFTIEDCKIASIWVLGDIEAVRRQLD